MKKNITIVVLSLLVLLLGGYLVYDKVLKEDDNEIEEQNPDENKVENEQINKVERETWIDNLLKQDIKEITLNYCPDKNESTSLKTYKLTIDELSKIFTPLKKEKLYKIESGGHGGYGCACCASIEVKYISNNREYTLKYNNNDIKFGIMIYNNENKTNSAFIADAKMLELMEKNCIHHVLQEDETIEENLQIRWYYNYDLFDLENENPIHEIVKNK